MEKNESKGVFLNGRKQVIELLQHLPAVEKHKLIKSMQLKNASLTKQLSEESLSFKDLNQLTDNQLVRVLQNINPTITGLALYLTPTIFQKRCLRLMSRESAQSAFNILKKNLSGQQSQCKKAQQKVLSTVIQLSKRGIIHV